MAGRKIASRRIMRVPCVKRPSPRTVNKLWSWAFNRCPQCLKLLRDSNGNDGEIHHIKPKGRKHPQYDPKQTDAQRHGFDNLILLCSGCHKAAHDNPARHLVASFREWKVQQSTPEQYEKSLQGRRLAQGEESPPLTSAVEKQDTRVAGYIQHLDEQIRVADNRGNQTMLREHLETLAQVHETARAWPQAAASLRTLSEIYVASGDFTQAIRAYRRLGYALLRTEDVREAREALQKGVLALRGLPRGAALKARAQLFELLGMACLRDGLPKLALRYLRDQALPDRKQLKAPLGIASTMSRMGLVYSALGERDKALASILDGLRIRYSTNAKTDTGRSLYSLGIVHHDQRELVLAAFVFRISLRWQEGCRGDAAQARAHFDLAEVFKDFLNEKHPMIAGPITFRQLRFPKSREKSLLTEIISHSFPKEMDWTLSVPQLPTLARFHYCECRRLAGSRLDQRILRIAEARLAMLDNKFPPP